MIDHALDRAAAAIATADALLIGAGAGMGVDSGLPDFRGKEGFWRAYPPYQRLGLDFVALANPRWFAEDATLAWGFYGHRMGLYRQTIPHAGFSILNRWTNRMKRGAFVFTSNVDGQFQRAGFDADRLVEVHGSFVGMQCTRECGIGVFCDELYEVEIAPESMRAIHPLPSCPRCGALVRPNILMFGDWSWDSERTDGQMRRMVSWIDSLNDARLVAIECGAGMAIPTVRVTCENAIREHGGTLVRINTREPDVAGGHVSIPMGALDALLALDLRVNAFRLQDSRSQTPAAGSSTETGPTASVDRRMEPTREHGPSG
jgi:NAD-dependent SIR2 family protein deacetylase